jgi:hypothetical protein
MDTLFQGVLKYGLTLQILCTSILHSKLRLLRCKNQPPILYMQVGQKAVYQISYLSYQYPTQHGKSLNTNLHAVRPSTT